MSFLRFLQVCNNLMVNTDIPTLYRRIQRSSVSCLFPRPDEKNILEWPSISHLCKGNWFSSWLLNNYGWSDKNDVTREQIPMENRNGVLSVFNIKQRKCGTARNNIEIKIIKNEKEEEEQREERFWKKQVDSWDVHNHSREKPPNDPMRIPSMEGRATFTSWTNRITSIATIQSCASSSYPFFKK